jgi:hypothetical protein
MYHTPHLQAVEVSPKITHTNLKSAIHHERSYADGTDVS